MKTRKTIKWIASILGASILVSTAAFTVVSCSSSSEHASNKYTSEEQKIINYRKQFLEKQYIKTRETADRYNDEWKVQYDDVLKKWATPLTDNLDISKKWYENWEPYSKPKDFQGKDGEYYLSWDNNTNFDEIIETSNSWEIGSYWFGLYLWLDSSTTENPDPEIITCQISGPIIINK